jgi:hypothetical protein
MSIIVSVKIHDGIVMAADSVTTFYTADGRPAQIYEHTDKIVNLVKGLPVGVMTCGAGGVGNASIATLLKDLRNRLAGAEDAQADWKFNKDSYTMGDLATLVYRFFSERAKEVDFKGHLNLRICGYSARRPLPEAWDITLNPETSSDPTCLQSEEDIGIRWNGEVEALDRMILGRGTRLPEAAMNLGLTMEQALEARDKITPQLYENLILPAAPIQDAIDLSRFLVETTKGFIRFSIARTKTVGGPVEIAAITKHEGFKWVQRKHFYHNDLNPKS